MELSSDKYLDDYTQSPNFPEFKYPQDINQTVPSFNTRKNNFMQQNKYESPDINILSGTRPPSIDGFSFYNHGFKSYQTPEDKMPSKSLISMPSKFDSNNSKFNLTNQVWPKTRTLLSICSKMFREKMISNDQRGVLKEMILDHNPNLITFLNVYESNNNYKMLYDNIIKLVSQYNTY